MSKTAPSTRYIRTPGTLGREDNSLTFRSEEKGIIHLPIHGLKELYLLNEITLNSKLLSFLSMAGITVHFFDYYGHFRGTFYPKDARVSGKVKLLQAKACLERRIPIAAAFIGAIAANIHEVLYHYYKHGNKEIKPYLDWLKKDVPGLLDKMEDIPRLLSVEGEIWRRFYDTFKTFLPEDFKMNKRVKRPPDNPLNALISFGNTILYTKTISQIYHTHLDQSISFLHEPSDRRFSLSLDLSEPFKPLLVYRTIFELVNNRRIQVNKHFEKDYNYCILNGTGRDVFITALEDRMKQVFDHGTLKRKVSYLSAIKYDAYKLKKHIVEGTPFVPFLEKEKR
ncbi:type I-B CRISPR-associated endonuclease Cas1b [Paenibacillus brasilensis]|uniref:CRISPR-associated endonuclease Cas1 n=1 Tax=Paenibacillus brasilensis TaxID=128574 RepID=A0ABU0KWU6_9BACL|nr:type I-B CRISPR-associated endonuclease Cas1b [Paenibacillus brasilensis]MDQ0492866.1 CRISPR-associated protein Cas1 [Paenibacillus brasilensis]